MMQKHDDDEESVHRISAPCKPCEKVVGETWIRLGEVLPSIITKLSERVAARGRGERDDDAQAPRGRTSDR